MQTITIVDTAICTNNLGDEIIMDAVNETVSGMFPDAYIFRVPSHESLSPANREFVRQSDLTLIGGTNLLSSRISSSGLWRLSPLSAITYGRTRTVCLGVGWNDYMPPPGWYSRQMLRTALSLSSIHSVRDNYTKSRLEGAGLRAVMTSCPSTWHLTPAHCRTIPRDHAPDAVFTLTAWRPDPVADKAFVDLLRKHYRRLYFFAQMRNDLEYFRSFGLHDIQLVPPNVSGFTRFLERENVDYVGTRLHAGIRALQKGRKALILAIDNRATELARDTGIPISGRKDTMAMQRWLETNQSTAIELDQGAIQAWKAQFRDSIGQESVTQQVRPDAAYAEAALV